MTRATPAERALVMIGVLPLLAAGVWLVLLREPTPATASTHGAGIRPSVEALVGRPEASFVGVIVAGQDAELGAELTGEVARVFVEPGARVRRGDPLLQLSALSVMGARGMAAAQALEDRSSLTAARLALENAKDKADRMASAPDAFPARDLATARTEAARAVAEFQRLRGTTALHRATLSRDLARADKQILRAPFDGVLAARLVDVGDFVTAGSPLARVVDDGRFVRFAVAPAQLARLQVGDAVHALLTGSSMPLSAAVVDLDPELDAAAGMGFARAKLDDVTGLALRVMPGSRVNVFVDAAAGVSP